MPTVDNAKYNRAVELIKNLDGTFLEFGGILRYAQEHDGLLFADLLKIPGLDKRTIYYLIEIDRIFAPLKIDKSLLSKVGWTKLAHMAKHVTPQNVIGLLTFAMSHTDRELQAKMAGKFIPANMRVVRLSLSPKQYVLYAKVLIKFGAKSVGKGLKGQENALMAVIVTALMARKTK